MRDDELAADLSLGAESTYPLDEHEGLILEAAIGEDVQYYRDMQESLGRDATLHMPSSGLLDQINAEIDELENVGNSATSDEHNLASVTELAVGPAIPLPSKETNGTAQPEKVTALHEGRSTSEHSAAGNARSWLAAAAIAGVIAGGLGFAGGYGTGKQQATPAANPTSLPTGQVSTPGPTTSLIPSGSADTTGASPDTATVLAKTQLASLEDKKPQGNAQLVRSAGGVQVVVSAEALLPGGAGGSTGSSTVSPSRSGYLEVWLINTDLKRMVSIGILTRASSATFAVPQKLIDEGYTIVDISQEEFDDKPQHSGKTLARGGLDV